MPVQIILQRQSDAGWRYCGKRMMGAELTDRHLTSQQKRIHKSSVCDCTVEDVEYIYNTLSLLLLLKMCILSLLYRVSQEERT